MTIIRLFLSPKGRIGRLAYFLGVLSVAAVQALVLAMVVASGNNKLALAVTGLLLLILGVPHWMLAIKRAHDLGKSVWWLLGNVFLMPVIGAGLVGASLGAAASRNAGLSLLLSLASLPFSLVSLWVCIKLFFFSGSGGSNNYGPPSNFLRHAFGDEDDIPMHAASTVARARIAETPAPAPAPRAKPATPPSRPARPAGFGRRGFTPA